MTLSFIPAVVTGMIGTTEIVLILAVILLLFGGKKLPELMRGLGQGVRSFKQGMAEDPEKGNAAAADTEVKLPDEPKSGEQA